MAPPLFPPYPRPVNVEFSERTRVMRNTVKCFKLICANTFYHFCPFWVNTLPVNLFIFQRFLKCTREFSFVTTRQ
jgi:hypothetical protein